jgi:hypothetical protein
VAISRVRVYDAPPGRVHNKKWTKTTLKWDFSLATNEMKELTRKTFDQWQCHDHLR